MGFDEIKGEIATKDFVRAEIEGVRVEIESVRGEIQNVRTEIKDTEARIIKWVFGIQFSIGALIIAVLKFL